MMSMVFPWLPSCSLWSVLWLKTSSSHWQNCLVLTVRATFWTWDANIAKVQLNAWFTRQEGFAFIPLLNEPYIIVTCKISPTYADMLSTQRQISFSCILFSLELCVFIYFQLNWNFYKDRDSFFSTSSPYSLEEHGVNIYRKNNTCLTDHVDLSFRWKNTVSYQKYLQSSGGKTECPTTNIC